MINWINHFVEKKIIEIPKDPQYDFRIFESAAKMHDFIQEINNKYGLARIVSTFNYIHKKDNQEYYVKEDDFKLPWNKDYGNITWGENQSFSNDSQGIYRLLLYSSSSFIYLPTPFTIIILLKLAF